MKHHSNHDHVADWLAFLVLVTFCSTLLYFGYILQLAFAELN